MDDLTEYSDDELSELQDAIREELTRRYERESAPQQITAAIESAVAAGVPLEELQHTIDDALEPDDDEDDGDGEDDDSGDDPPSGSE